jgi:hypothetical protein
MNSMSIVISLDIKVDSNSPSGAGWYAQGLIDGKPVGELVYLPEDKAIALAQIVNNEEVTTTSPSAVELVMSGNQLVKQVLPQQLKYAEEQATRIAMLRNRLKPQTEGTDVRYDDSSPAA